MRVTTIAELRSLNEDRFGEITVIDIRPSEKLDDLIAIIAKILMSGKAREGLEIYFDHPLFPNDLAAFKKALISGYAPKRLKLNFRAEGFDTEIVNTLFDAIETGHGPIDLILGLNNERKGRFPHQAQCTFFDRLHLVMRNNSLPKLGGLHIQTILENHHLEQLFLMLSVVDLPSGFSFIIERQSHTFPLTAFDKMLQRIPESFEFSASHTQLGDGGACIVAKNMTAGSNKHKSTIALWHNSINSRGSIAFAEAIQSPNCSKDIDLSLCFNPIGREGVMALAEALSSDKVAEGFMLRLSFEPIKDYFCMITDKLAAKRLQNHRPSLAVQNIDNDSVIHLARCLLKGNLKKLAVSGNSILETGIKNIADALEYCPDGFELDLSGAYHYGEKGIIALANAISEGRVPTNFSLKIEYTNCTTQAQAIFVEALKTTNVKRGLNVKIALGNTTHEHSNPPPFYNLVNLRIAEIKHRDFINSIINAVETAQTAYEQWNKNPNSKNTSSSRGSAEKGGLFSGLRHGERGLNNSITLLTNIKDKTVFNDVATPINQFLTDAKTAYHVHSFSTFLLTELRQIPNTPWEKIQSPRHSGHYSREDVSRAIRENSHALTA